MDVPRGKEVARKKLIRRIALIAVILAAIPLITWGLSRLKPAAPSVDRATVWIDTVKRGPMLREVVVWAPWWWKSTTGFPPQFESRVEKINFLPGAKLHPNDVIMVLKNPQMELDAADLEAQIKQAQAVYDNLKVTLETARLAQEAITEQVKSDMDQAALAGGSRSAAQQAGFEIGHRRQAFGREMGRFEEPLRAFEEAVGHQHRIGQGAA